MFSYRSLILTFSILCCSVFMSYSQLITSSVTVKLSGPVSKEIMEQAKKTATIKMKAELLVWMQENLGVSLDTSNALDNYHFDIFLYKCLKKAREESAFKGTNWTFTFLMNPDTIKTVVDSYNDEIDTAAIRSWQLFTNAVTGNKPNVAFIEGLKTLSYATAHFGAPIQNPQQPGHDFVDDVKKAVQDLVNRIQVTSSEMVLKGKAGLLPENPIVITSVIDSIPIENLYFSATHQNGRELFSLSSDSKGQISLSQIKLPFVSTGTLMNMSFDLGKTIGAPQMIDAKDFGISLNNSQDQTFIFKLTRPTYILDYKTTSVSNLQLPADFTTDAYLRKFLKDTCYMEPVSAGSAPDLEISCNSQISSYSYDEADETAVKLSTLISIKNLSTNPPKTEQNSLTFEKRYDRSTSIPLGLFFWEVNGKLRTSVKGTLEKL